MHVPVVSKSSPSEHLFSCCVCYRRMSHEAIVRHLAGGQAVAACCPSCWVWGTEDVIARRMSLCCCLSGRLSPLEMVNDVRHSGRRGRIPLGLADLLPTYVDEQSRRYTSGRLLRRMTGSCLHPLIHYAAAAVVAARASDDICMSDICQRGETKRNETKPNLACDLWGRVLRAKQGSPLSAHSRAMHASRSNQRYLMLSSASKQVRAAARRHRSQDRT